jgi:hypothetical protein
MFGGLNLSIINQVIGIGVLLAIPAVPEFICQKIGSTADKVFGNEIYSVTNRGVSSGRQIGGGARRITGGAITGGRSAWQNRSVLASRIPGMGGRGTPGPTDAK